MGIEKRTESNAEIARGRLIKAFHAWNKEIVANPEGFDSETKDTEEFAILCADTLIGYLDKVPIKK